MKLDKNEFPYLPQISELNITKNCANLQQAYFEYCVHGLHT